MKTVAVIMAAWKADRYIREAIESIAAQRLPQGWRMELRIGVDACPLTQAFLRTHGVAHWWSEENVGSYVIRNSLIELGDADLYAVFDSDDRMRPGYLAKVIELAGEDAVAGVGRISIHPNGARFTQGRQKPPMEYWRHGVPAFGPKVWRALGGFRPWRVAADSDFVARAVAMGIPTRSSREPLFERRRHPGQMTQDRSLGMHSTTRKLRIKETREAIKRGELVVPCVTTPLVPWSGKEDALEWEKRTMEYWEERKGLAYYQRVRHWIERLPGDSLLDVGPADTPIAIWGSFKERVTVDLEHDPGLPGVQSVVADFLTWEPGRTFDVVTCLQVVEHQTDDRVKRFAAKLLTLGTWLIVSVPYEWAHRPDGQHPQDPINMQKLVTIMGQEPLYTEVVQDNKRRRLIAVYGPHPLPVEVLGKSIAETG